MTLTTQKRLAWAGALIVLAIVIASNAHLISVAFRSQPECVAAKSAVATPAKRAC